MKKIIVLGVLAVVMMQSCKKIKEDDVEPYKGKNYFPVNTGHEVIFDVKNIMKSSVTGLWDTAAYQVKEVSTGTYTDPEGRLTQTIERYIDNDTTSGFVLYKTWAASLLTSSAHRVEDNIRYIKLIFPQSTSNVWDGNSLNTLGQKNYHYAELHVPLTVGSLAFDSTCTVVQADDSTVFGGTIKDVNYNVEQYATNVGLIYKINMHITYTANDTIQSAAIYTETIKSYIE
jgi:hypothetical protein